MKRENNFDLLRLVFAALVIFSHSPQLIYGDDSPRELLMGLTGTLTLGEVAVAGFFLLSGYLVTKSYEQSKTMREYVLKRALRIYPGFLVAYFASIYIFGTLGGGDPPLDAAGLFKVAVHALTFHTPEVPGTFAGLPVPVVNGSMWTISYEFRCYLLVIACGLLGFLRRQEAMIAVAGLLVALSVVGNSLPLSGRANFVTGSPDALIPFAAYFFTGSVFYLFRDRIRYRGALAAAAAVSLCVLIFSRHLAQASLAICGGYLVFWLALGICPGNFERFQPRQDISYGLYLYGWPVQSLLIYWLPGLAPWAVSVLALPIAGLLGWLSWVYVEHPALRLKAARIRRGQPVPSH